MLALVCVLTKWLGVYMVWLFKLVPTEINKCNVELRGKYDDL